MKKTFLAVIPARGGSKGIPRKNLVTLGGIPLLQYTLEAAAGSDNLNRVVFTSDDPEMMALAQTAGIEVPFRRPDFLATDDASSVDVVIHALDWLTDHEQYVPDAVVLLQPTCPFRTAADIDEAIAIFDAGESECLMSVSPVLQHPCEMVTRDDGKLVWAVSPPAAGRRQLFPTYYFINGATYIVTTRFLKDRRRFDDPSAALQVIDPRHGIDIDDSYQLELARTMLSLGNVQ